MARRGSEAAAGTQAARGDNEGAMTNKEVCKKVRKLLPALMRKGWRRDLDKMLEARGQELWLIGIDTKNKRLSDICGTIEPSIMDAINARGFFNTDAGYKGNAQLKGKGGATPVHDWKY